MSSGGCEFFSPGGAIAQHGVDDGEQLAGATIEGRLMCVLGGAGGTDVSNIFGVIFDAHGHDMPLSWRNPAVPD